MSTPVYNSNDSSPHSSPLASKHNHNNNHNGNGGGHHPNKLFVGGISWRADEAGLSKYFSTFGHVLECKIILDRTTLKSKGYGFVTFEKEESVAKVKSAPSLTYMGKNMNVGDAIRKFELVSSMNAAAASSAQNGSVHHISGAAVSYHDEPLPLCLDEEVPSNEMLEPIPYGHPGSGYYVFYDFNGNVFFQQLTPPYQIFSAVQPYHYQAQQPPQQQQSQQYLPPQYYPPQQPPQLPLSMPTWGRANQTVPYIRSPTTSNPQEQAYRSPPPTTNATSSSNNNNNPSKTSTKHPVNIQQSPDNSPNSTNH